MIFNSEYSLDNVIKAKKLLFLAGSIDLHFPGDWRKTVSSELGDKFNFFDPTTLDYNSLDEDDWVEHIEWELLAMEMSDLILINFLPEAQSPISLVELGLNTNGKKLVVVCPQEFYKNQYITVLCKHYSVPIFEDLNSATEYINANLKTLLI